MKNLSVVLCVAGMIAIMCIGMLKTEVASAGYTARPTVADGPEPVEDSMHEFMEYVFQPTYKRLKVTMANAPADNAGWKAMKSDALILAESCNLLYGRCVNDKTDDWDAHTTASRSAAASLYKAAKAKDFEKASECYRTMLNKCNACHKQYENGKHILQP
ncbi:MAG: hypothetical protein R3C20_06940 [Planctomycetaceae bacterium]